MKKIVEKIKNKIFNNKEPEEVKGESYSLSDFNSHSENLYFINLTEKFNHISYQANLNIDIKTTNENSYIELYTKNKINNNIFIDCSEFLLKIRSVGKFDKDNTHITIFININDFNYLSSITNKSGSIINCEYINFNQENITFNVYGKGDIIINSLISDYLTVNHKNQGSIIFKDINPTNIELKLSKSAVVKIQKGNADYINIFSHDSAKIIAKNFKVKKAEINLNSTGNTLLDVLENVKGHISGIGNLQLSNEKVKCDVRMSGLGSIKFK